jgi:polysaccharide biosynthesis protein PslH
MRILFLSRWYPSPADNGSKIRIANLLKGICRQHEVTFLSFADPSDGPGKSPQPFEGPREIRTCEFREFNPRSFRALSGFLSPVPRYLIDTYNPSMDRLIRETVARTRFDVVVASQLTMASYHSAFQGIPAILEEAELAMFQPDLDAGAGSLVVLRRRLTWAKHRRYVAGVLKHFRLCTVASEPEQKLVSATAPGGVPVYVVPNFIHTEQYHSPSPDARFANSLIFTGSLRFGPNHDAVSWFVQEVFPKIQRKVSGVRFTVTGDPGSLPRPEAPGVFYTGRVEDVRTVMANSTVSVVPIRHGGGTRLKILEAMAMGMPVVTTSKGVEGIEARNGEHILVADTPNEFAVATTRLLLNPDYARKLADAARKLVQSQYDSRAVLPIVSRLLDEAVAVRPTASGKLAGTAARSVAAGRLH